MGSNAPSPIETSGSEAASAETRGERPPRDYWFQVFRGMLNLVPISFALFLFADGELSRFGRVAAATTFVIPAGWFWIRSAVISAILATRTVSEG